MLLIKIRQFWLNNPTWMNQSTQLVRPIEDVLSTELNLLIKNKKSKLTRNSTIDIANAMDKNTLHFFKPKYSKATVGQHDTTAL